MRNKPWDLFMVHLLGTDRIQHEFWHLLDPAHPLHDALERQRYGNVILDFFRRVDAAVGRLLDALDEATIVLVMSDHGFGPVKKFININTWLLEQGLLRLKRTPVTGLRALLFRVGLNYATAAKWILKLGLGRRAKAAGRAQREHLQRRLFLSMDDVDWSRSKVYSMGNFGQLFVNLKGREPQGIVEPGAEYEELLTELRRRLRALADPNTGEPVVEQVFPRDELFDGPYAEQAADLVFLTQGMNYKAMGLSDFSSSRVFDAVYGTTGHHRMNGAMIWHGPGAVKGGERYEGARIHDLAPTILYTMGMPIPVEMDGRPLVEVFTPGFREQHRLVFAEAGERSDRDGESDYSAQEEAELRDTLRALGYVT
jgi:predicted AlkP superfamily phosphohydrolase/phosphomutase